MRFVLLLLLGSAGILPAGPPASSRRSIVILGDSVAHGEGDESRLRLAGHIDRELARRGIAHAPAVDAAISGSRTWQLSVVLRRPAVRDAIRHADAVILSIGGNDLYGDSRARLMSLIAPGLAMDVTLDRMTALVRRIRSMNGHARIFLLGVYNPYGAAALDRHVAMWTSKLFARFAEEKAVTVVPIADLFTHRARLSPTDRFHPNAEAYGMIARRVVESLH